MNHNLPHTPFSTALSGSAKETERRLKNIFSGPKKRPPIPFLVLIFAACLLCGNLVSCNVAETAPEGDPARLDNTQQGNVSPDNQEHEPAWVTYMQGESPLGDTDQALLDALFRAAERENGYKFQIPTVHLRHSMEKDGWMLGVVFVEDHLENTLILGVMDRETKEVPHGVFQCSYHVGVPNTVIFQNYDGEDCLLYTFNGMENGQYTGEAGMVRFDGEFMTWLWPVEGDARYVTAPPGAAPGAYEEYQEYWYHHLALLAPGGVDIYTVNPDFTWGGDVPASMWQLETDEIFYYDSSSAVELPMPIYFQSLNWLNAHCEFDAGWRIRSLILNEEKSDPEARLDCYTLWACTDDDQNELVTDLFFSYDLEGGRKFYNDLDHGEIYENYDTLPRQIGEP